MLSDIQMKQTPYSMPIILILGLSILLHLAVFLLYDLFHERITVNLVGQESIHVKLSNSYSSQQSAPVEPSAISKDALLEKQKADSIPIEITKSDPVKSVQAKAIKPITSTLSKKAEPPPVAPQKVEIEESLVNTTITQITPDESAPKRIEATKLIKVPEIKVVENTSDVSKKSTSKSTDDAPQQESSSPRYQLGSAANPKPDYPMLARKKGWQGDVILGVHLNQDGSIKHLTFVKSTHYSVLNHAAYETVRTQWTFEPLTMEVDPEDNYLEVPISFRFD